MPSRKKASKAKRQGNKAEKMRLRAEEREAEKERVKIVNKANEVDDVLSDLAPFASYKREEIDVALKSFKRSQLPKEYEKWCFGLLKSNMQDIYEDGGWGWKDSEKSREVRAVATRSLVCRSLPTLTLVRFVHRATAF